MAKRFIWAVNREGAAEKTAFDVRAVQFGGGYEQRQPKFLKGRRRTWEVSKTDYREVIEEIRAFLDGTRGVEAFEFQPLKNEPPLLVKAAEYRCEPLGGRVWRFSATFEEVWA